MANMRNVVHAVKVPPALFVEQIAALPSFYKQRLAVAKGNVGPIVLLTLLQCICAATAAVRANAAGIATNIDKTAAAAKLTATATVVSAAQVYAVGRAW